MNTAEKKLIAREIKTMCAKESQGKIAKKAGGSTATISQIVNNNHKLIKAEMWQKIKITLRLEWGWQSAMTNNTRLITDILNAVKSRSMSVCISHNPGVGKSHTYKLYDRAEHHVIYLEAKNYWTKKSFVKALLRATGKDDAGTCEVLIERWMEAVKGLEKPLVIFDQMDKLKDSQFDLFMDFYNELDGHCGFVLSGVPALKKRIERGCQLDKIGYREIRSRIGGKFIAFPEITEQDVRAVCQANGLEDQDHINEIYNTCEGDLRRVKREVEKYHLQQSEIKKSA